MTFATVTVLDTNLRCLESDQPSSPCAGAVEFRDLGRDAQYARCDAHFAVRLEVQERINCDYPDSPHAPSWFDPTAAGESWDED